MQIQFFEEEMWSGVEEWCYVFYQDNYENNCSIEDWVKRLVCKERAYVPLAKGDPTIMMIMMMMMI
jgi:hypothetical protein